MAHLFKPQKTYYVDAEGRRVDKDTPGAKKVKEEARKWYCKGPPFPKGKAIPLAADKRAAMQMLAELERKVERGETAIGGSEVEASKRSIKEHLADFERHLRAKCKNADHVRKAISRCRRIVADCGIERIPDIDAVKVQRFLADLTTTERTIAPLDPKKETYTRKELAAILDITPGAVASLVARHRLPATGNGKARRFPRETAEALRERLRQPAGIQTAKHYLASMKSFVRWLVDHERLARNPLAKLLPGNVEADQRRDRRALPVEELVRLFQAAGTSEHTFRGLTGQDRLVLYVLAAGTGFRAGELAVLTPELFALDAAPPTVALPAREDKAGRRVVQPLPPALVEMLRGYLAARPKRQPIWPGTWHERAADMLRADLEAAGIPYIVEGPDGPLHADFHSLRHSFVALLENAGLSLKQAMSLARHSDPKLTMKRYGKAELAELGQAVGRLPELTMRDAVEKRSALDDLPKEVIQALAVFGIASLAAGWFGTDDR